MVDKEGGLGMLTKFMEEQARQKAQADAVAQAEAEAKARAMKNPDQLASILLADPLYTEYPDAAELSVIDQLRQFSGPFDAHCPECGRHSVFNLATTRTVDTDNNGSMHLWLKAYTCSRNSNHRMLFLFATKHGIGVKVGQYPSIADLADADSAKYAKVLGQRGYREFKRATGLAAHGVGVGSFVYLRRIFENLVNGAYEHARKVDGWDDAAWNQARMLEKIQLLRGYLPEFLIEQRNMYGILSRGIHELTEEDCLAHFDVVKGAIEIVLDAKLEEQSRLEKQEQIAKRMRAAQAALGKASGDQ